MRHTDTFGLDFVGQSGKVVVAQLPSGHLDAHMVLRGIEARVEMNTVELHTQAFAKVGTELFVAVGFVAAQLEIAMDGLYLIAQLP